MKKAIITGGTRGFGLAFKNKLDSLEFKTITVASKNADHSINLTTNDGTATLIRLIENEKPSIVILNAGILAIKPFEDYSQKEIEDMLYINGTNKILVLNHFFTDIKKGNIKFYVTTSISGKIPSPLMVPYSASKAYITNAIESMNGELIAQSIQNLIVDITPGFIDTTSQSQEVKEFADKVIETKGRRVFNNKIYEEVMLKPIKDFDSFVKESYLRKHKRITRR